MSSKISRRYHCVAQHPSPVPHDWTSVRELWSWLKNQAPESGDGRHSQISRNSHPGTPRELLNFAAHSTTDQAGGGYSRNYCTGLDIAVEALHAFVRDGIGYLVQRRDAQESRERRCRSLDPARTSLALA